MKLDLENEETSYLRPRDPSLNNEHLTFEAIRFNLAQSSSQECLGGKNQQALGSMQIYLRMKNSEQQSDELYEVDEKTIVCRAPGAEFEKRFKFSNIFEADSTQTELFDTVVKPKVFQFIGGHSSSLFAYGASGSGKTFTMMGTAAQPGIVPRTLEYLFKSLPKIPDSVSFKPDATDDIVFLSPADQLEQKRIHDRLLHASSSSIDRHHVETFKAMQQRLSTEPAAIVEDQDELFLGVWVSFAEIYNEDIFDLLRPPLKKRPREKLAIKMSGARPHIKDLTAVNASNSLEAYQMLQYGLHNLRYASTCVNFHSSRSHSVFTIKLVQGSLKTKEYIISCFNFCDLAGSERLKRTLNTGERLKESNSINTSLLVLGKCIRSIISSQKSRDNRPVPYRESKLTRLFQRALQGLEDIAMIVNVNPEREVFEETLHALNFSAIAKEVRVNDAAKIVKQMEGDEVETSQEEEDAETRQLEELMLELTEELEARESEFQDEVILTRSQMLDECKRAMARANQEYEKETKRVQRYYEDLYEEELESWKRSYEEETPGGVSEEELESWKRSYEEETPGGVSEEDAFIVLDSSDDDEESFERATRSQYSKESKLETNSPIDDCKIGIEERLKTIDLSSPAQLEDAPNGSRGRIKVSTPMWEEQFKADDDEYDGGFKSNASDELVTETSPDGSSELKEEKSRVSFEMQGYSDEVSSLEARTKTIDSSSPALLEDAQNSGCEGRMKESTSMLEEQLETDEGEYDGESKRNASAKLATETSPDGSSQLKEEKSRISSKSNSWRWQIKESTSMLEEQLETDEGECDGESKRNASDKLATEASPDGSSQLKEEKSNSWRWQIKESTSMLEEQLETDGGEYDGGFKPNSSSKLATEVKEEKGKTSFELQDYSDDDDYETNECERECELEMRDESATDSCLSFTEELNEAETKMRETLALFEIEDSSGDEVDVVAKDECGDYLKKSADESKSFNKTITKSVTESRLEFRGGDEGDGCEASILNRRTRTMRDLGESADQSTPESFKPIKFDSKSDSEESSEDDHMNVIKEIFT